jgi:YVTN family beta-propeller protein
MLIGLAMALAVSGARADVTSQVSSRSAAATAWPRVYIRALGLPAHTGPQLFLGPSQKLPASFRGAARLVSRLNAGRAHAVAEVAGDLNHDGIGDLLVGYALPEEGAVGFFRGNQDAFAPQSVASFRAIRKDRFPVPFFPQARVSSLPVRPDFLATGTFAGRPYPGLIVAARGGHALYVFGGDGTGRFGDPRVVRVPGSITTVAAGAFGRSQTTVLVGISAHPGHSFSLLVYGQTRHGLGLRARYPLQAPASSIQLAGFGDPGPDAVLLAGGRVLVLRSSTMRLRALVLPFSVVAMAVGSFIYDRHASPQLALLTRDGALHVAVHPQFDPRSYSASEWKVLRQAGLRTGRNPLLPYASVTLRGWKVVETTAGVARGSLGRPPLLVATRVSSHAADDLMVLDAAAKRMTLVEHPDLPLGAKTFRRAVVSSRSYSGSTVAAVAARVNVDGRPGLLTIQRGELAPSVMMPLPDPTFTVNRFDDPAPVSPITNACNGVASCSVREAILRANATAGTDTVMVPAGTYTLTRPKVTNDYSGNNGALYVNDSVNIVGAGQNSTIIQAGTTAYNAGTANGVDMVMAVNEDINPITNATANISNLTLQNGHNLGTHGNDGDGGCMEFDTGSSGNANLTFTNVTLQNCDTTKGNGAGIAIFNFTSPANGLVTFTNSVVQGNSAVDSTSGVAAGGGGVWVSQDSRMSMTGSQVLNNKAAQVTGGVGGVGGGVFIFNNTSGSRQTVIHNSTISGNQAGSRGGGIYNSANLLVDQGTVISGNSAGKAGVLTVEGGGIYDNTSSNGCPGACTDTLTLNKVMISGNTAGNGSIGSGGGIYHGNLTGAGSLTMTLSRIAGNTATTAGSNLFEDHSVANVTDNWWGTNAPSGTITNSGGTTTFSPFIVLTNTASPNAIKVNQTSTLTADFLHDSNGGSLTTSQITVLLGLPVTWGNAVKGSLSNQQTTIQSNGTATATFTATAAGAGSGDATVDNGVATGSITISKADTSTSISSESPDPSVTGQPLAVGFHVTSSTGSSPTAPSGNVTVSDGTDSCSGGINGSGDGSCNVAFTSVGSKSLTATYGGDSNFNASPASSPATGHTVNKADTTTSISSESPDPSVVGQAVTIKYAVSVNSPGAGSPTGNVTVSDGTLSCTGTVAAGQCSISFTSPGSKSLTASYGGDSNFNASPASSPATGHTVNKADTTTSISSESPDPSFVGQAVTIKYGVSVNSPGAATLSGNVTVSDGTDSCTGTVGAGQCSILFTSAGSKSLTASYGGNTNLNASSSSPATAHGVFTVNAISVGMTPTGVAVGASKAYVANQASNSVSVIDLTQNPPVVSPTPIAVGNMPDSAALSADGSRLYVPNFKDGTLSIIATATNTVSHTVAVGSRPTGVVEVGGSVYVANLLSGTISVVDPAAGTVSKTINLPGAGTPTGAAPSGLVASQDGHTLYADDARNGKTYVVDLTHVPDPAVTGSVSVGVHPAYLSVAGSLGYVANPGSNTVSVLNLTPSPPTVTQTINVGTADYGVVAVPALKEVFATNSGSNNLTVIDTTAAPTVALTVATGKVPDAIALSPDQRTVVVSNEADNTISIFHVPQAAAAAQTSTAGSKAGSARVKLKPGGLGLVARIVRR